MKLALSRSLAFVGLGLLTFAAAHAQTTGVGPYYATPSWDQTLPSATRFIVLSNFNSAAVLDRETGLVWQRSHLGTRNEFSLASTACLESQVGNRAGWRVPTINELASVLDPSAAAGPAFPPGHPFVGFDPMRSEIWSATVVTYLPSAYHFAGWLAYGGTIGFQVNLGAASIGSSGFPLLVWCVRGGLFAGAQ